MRNRLVLSLAILLIFLPCGAFGYDWPQFAFNPSHTGLNNLENSLNAGNVAGMKMLFRAPLPDVVDGPPVYVSGVPTSSGTLDVLYVLTRTGTIIALNAHSAAQIWSQGNPPGDCKINNGSNTCYTTSSPVIDPGRQYVYAYGLDGRVHKYEAGDGVEIKTGGWPELVTTKPFDEKGSSALAIATSASGSSYLYTANGGYPGDAGDYQGHVTVIKLADGSQHVFNATCSNQVDVHFLEKPATPDCSRVQTAVWARPGVVYDDENDKIYFATGNGDFVSNGFSWGDSVLALTPDGIAAGGNPLDSYTPSNFQQLDNDDLDLGSTAPAILPASSGKILHLGVQSGKDALLRLINLDNLSGQGKPGQTGGEIGSPVRVPQGGEVLTQPVVWTNPADEATWIFVSNNSGLSALKVANDNSGNPNLAPVWHVGGGGSSPVLAKNILYSAGSGLVRALDPATSRTLWQDTSIGGIHWESPIVVNGRLYITDEDGYLTAYALPKPSPNPIDDPTFFVTQHYDDFLNRTPDEAGLDFWVNQITGCESDQACTDVKKINVSAAFFLSIEFQQTGYLVHRLYKASYGRNPQFAEFIPDAQMISQGVVVGASGWQNKLDDNTSSFISQWVTRLPFRTAYNALSNQQYINALVANTGVAYSDKDDALVSGLNNGTLTRTDVLTQVVTDDDFVKAESNRAFVEAQYFGYLRRDPDAPGFQFWLSKLNQFDGNYIEAEMVKAFLTSAEYRERFGQS